jgi:hypothetical protein
VTFDNWVSQQRRERRSRLEETKVQNRSLYGRQERLRQHGVAKRRSPEGPTPRLLQPNWGLTPLARLGVPGEVCLAALCQQPMTDGARAGFETSSCSYDAIDARPADVQALRDGR